MVVKAQMAKWGNSLAVRIPRNVAEAAGFRKGDCLVLEVESEGALKVKAAKAPPTLAELVAQITPENLHKEQWSDAAVGNEAW